jgi:geranylgeranyl reductase family protein
MRDYDAIVVGGGPAGSICARTAAERGARVLLLDKASFPREKACGDAVSGKAIRVLREMRLKEKLESRPHAKILGVHLSSPNGTELKISIPQTRADAYAYCMRREVLDNVLFEHASKVCEFREKTQVVGLVKENEKIVGVKVADLSTKQTREITANVIVGADGATSLVAQHLNANALPPQHACIAVRSYYQNVSSLTDRIEIHFVPEALPGYFWIFPLGNGQCNVGVGMILSEIQKRKVHLPHVLETIIQSSRFASRFVSSERKSPVMGWTLPFGSHERTLAFDGALLCGDAAALIDPFTGEGVGNAMLSGKMAGETIASAIEKNDFSVSFLSQYEKNVRDLLTPEFQTSYTLQKWSRYPFLINLAFSKAAKKPKIQSILSSMLADETPRKQLVNPTNWFKLLIG